MLSRGVTICRLCVGPWLLAVLIAGCGFTQQPQPVGASLPTLMPSPTGPPPATASLPPADTGWQAAAPGVEQRRLQVLVADRETSVSVARLDPRQVRFSVGYAPDAPRSLTEWTRASGALVAINGGFFDEAGHSVALLVHDGQAIGASYRGRGGMFAVSPTGAVALRSLADAPYEPAEPLAEALQGWPMLVTPEAGAVYDHEDGVRARRSALAIDRDGRVLFIAVPAPAFTLRELAVWLVSSDLEVSAAVNLDGGASTGLIVQSARAPVGIEPFVPLPIVLLALPGP